MLFFFMKLFFLEINQLTILIKIFYIFIFLYQESAYFYYVKITHLKNLNKMRTEAKYKKEVAEVKVIAIVFFTSLFGILITLANI